MVYAVHQPDFLPWFGFFNKIKQSDVFVILDDAQFQKTGGSYMNRVQFLINGEPKHFTVPIVRNYHGTRLVNEAEYRGEDWKERWLKTFQTNYARCMHFPEAMDLVRSICAVQRDGLCDFNMAAVELICEGLGLGTDRFVRSSSLGVGATRAQRIVDIGLAVGCCTYLSGTGARAYNDEDLFRAAGIRLTYQQFEHPRYRQPGVEEFCPGLSILDVIANCGLSETARLLVQAAEATH